MNIASLMVDTAAKVVTLDKLEVFDRATVNVKVVELKEEMQVGGKSKRDIIIADGSGTARVGGTCEYNGGEHQLLSRVELSSASRSVIPLLLGLLSSGEVLLYDL